MKNHLALVLLFGVVSLIASCGKNDNSSTIIPVTPITPPTSSTTIGTSTTVKTTIVGSLRKPIYDLLTEDASSSFNLMDTVAYKELPYDHGFNLTSTDPYYTLKQSEADWLIAAMAKSTRKFVRVGYGDKTIQLWYIPELRDNYYVILITSAAHGANISYEPKDDMQYKYADGNIYSSLQTDKGALTNLGNKDPNQRNRILFFKP